MKTSSILFIFCILIGASCSDHKEQKTSSPIDHENALPETPEETPSETIDTHPEPSSDPLENHLEASVSLAEVHEAMLNQELALQSKKVTSHPEPETVTIKTEPPLIRHDEPYQEIETGVSTHYINMSSEPCAEMPDDCTPTCDCGCCPSICCEPRVYVDHVEGRWLDNREGYTSLGVFLPLTHGNFLPFLDVRSHVFNDGWTAANLGGGFRIANNDASAIFGINAFYDYRKAAWSHYYRQVGVGMEVLSECLDFRLNGYFPIERTSHGEKHFFRFADGFKATCQQRRQSLSGFDAELGRYLCNCCCDCDCCCCFNLYAALGFYSYFPDEHEDNIYGGQLRLASKIGRYLELEVRAGYDRINHTMAQGRVTFTLPLCCETCDTICNWMCQPIFRQEIIALGKKDCCWTWNWGGHGCHCR